MLGNNPNIASKFSSVRCGIHTGGFDMISTFGRNAASTTHRPGTQITATLTAMPSRINVRCQGRSMVPNAFIAAPPMKRRATISLR